jgi:ligand-binding sensor domain-containing protein
MTLVFFLAAYPALGQGNWALLDTSNTPMPFNEPSFVAFDHDGALWTTCEYNGGTGFGLYRFEGGTWTVFDESDVSVLTNGVRNAACDQNGHMWFVVHSLGLLSYDGSNWMVVDTSNSGLPSNWVYTFTIDGQNRLWVGYEEGLFGGVACFDGTDWTVWDQTNSPFTEPYMAPWSMAVFDGGLWVGGAFGMLRLEIASNTWTDESGQLGAAEPQAVVNDGAGNLWVGYYGGFGVGGQVISQFDGTTWTHHHPWTQEWTRIDGFARDSTGRVWCGSTAGLWYFDGIEWQVHGDPLPTNAMSSFTHSVAVAPNGSIWWGVSQQGIWTNDAHVTTVPEAISGGGRCLVQPNPMTGQALLTPDADLGDRVELQLLDNTGRLVRKLVFARGTPMMIERGTLAPGLYTCLLVGDNGLSSIARFVVR